MPQQPDRPPRPSRRPTIVPELDLAEIDRLAAVRQAVIDRADNTDRPADPADAAGR